ncbi:hypothetical protein [Komagataeibacter sp. FNDCF1]|uniref:hypothetical protein n=1 Tax=Komagataeibacter sp. FNDCF1 TaxID=2878681 RepID=UPI001E50F08A|nr:hypothetical protein [Komagataeibacter sp. FNDCF1]MCE2563337.1 hypothetical protein [Komagataeibacter sp. FNDCF1]
MNVTSHFGFFYKGYRVECTRKEARIILKGRVVGKSKAISRAAIEQDVERVIARRREAGNG